MVDNKFPGKDISEKDIKEKFPLCAKKNKNHYSVFEVEGVEFGADTIPVMAGPNMVESKELILEIKRVKMYYFLLIIFLDLHKLDQKFQHY